MVKLSKVSDAPGLADAYGVGTDTKLLEYNFVLVSESEVVALRQVEALKAAGTLSDGLKVVDGSISY